MNVIFTIALVPTVKLLLALTLAPLALPAAVTYTCPSGQSFTVQLDKKATRAILTVPGRPNHPHPPTGAPEPAAINHHTHPAPHTP
ncbi:MAG: hypothetical protein ACK6D7_21460, partial [Acidobacteriota bacterium]